MRITTPISLLSAAALFAVAGCVKDVEQPALAGPSTFATSIIMVAERDTLTQNGSDFTDIRITALGPDGQSQTIPLSAQIYVNGVPGDFGTLSTKTPITPTTIRYTAPAASAIAAGQAATATIVVTPRNAGDFRGEVFRQIDIGLVPQGIILPSNPNLVAAFTFAPATPQAFQTVSLDASTSTDNGVACLQSCSYSWNFGDGTSGIGLTTTHQFRTAGNLAVTLTVTDTRASASKTTSITVTAPTPPTVSFTMSPSNPGTNQAIFFNASASRAATGRTLVSYEWDFGKGTTGSGVTTSKAYETPGTYTVTLKVTDDAGAFTVVTQTVTIGGAASLPTAAFTFSPTTNRAGTSINFDATASRPASSPIVDYKFIWGDGSPDASGTAGIAVHVFASAGT